MIFTFKKKYFLLFLIFFIVEVFIAIFIKDRIIRPYVGDFLVIILLYCFLKSFIRISHLKAAILVFVFACFIEALQAFDFLKITGLNDKRIASVVLGNHFDWADILLYFLGTLFILISEALLKKKDKI